MQRQQEIDRQRLQNEMRTWQGRDEQDEARMAQIQAALDQFEDMQATGILGSFESEQDRNDRASVAMDRGDSRSYGPQ